MFLFVCSFFNNRIGCVLIVFSSDSLFLVLNFEPFFLVLTQFHRCLFLIWIYWEIVDVGQYTDSAETFIFFGIHLEFLEKFHLCSLFVIVDVIVSAL